MHAFARFFATQLRSAEPGKDLEHLKRLWAESYVPEDLFATVLPPKLCQGDIVDPITFIVQDDAGDFGEVTKPGMILSHSCDIDQDDTLVLAACKPFSAYENHKAVGAILNNTAYSLCYFAAVPTLGKCVVDFGTLQAVDRVAFERSLANGTIRRLASLTELGYYFLLAKMTVRFLRLGPADEVREVSTPGFLKRAINVLTAGRALVRYLVKGNDRDLTP